MRFVIIAALMSCASSAYSFGFWGGALQTVSVTNPPISGDGTAGSPLNLVSSSVTLQGNQFNGNNQLVLLDGAGALPAIDGSALTGIAGETNTFISTKTFIDAVKIDGQLLVIGSGTVQGDFRAGIANAFIVKGGSVTIGKVGGTPRSLLHVGDGDNAIAIVGSGAVAYFTNAGYTAIAIGDSLSNTQVGIECGVGQCRIRTNTPGTLLRIGVLNGSGGSIDTNYAPDVGTANTKIYVEVPHFTTRRNPVLEVQSSGSEGTPAFLVSSTTVGNLFVVQSNGFAWFVSSVVVLGAFSAPHVSSDSFVYKEVDESLNSSVTLQADDELKISLKPSTTYHISALEFHIQSTNATPDFDFAFNYTVAQSTIELTCLIADKNNTLTLAHFDDFNVEQTIDIEADVEAIARCHGTIITGPGSNGEFQLLWAQNVSNGADVIVEARALMRVSEISNLTP